MSIPRLHHLGTLLAVGLMASTLACSQHLAAQDTPAPPAAVHQIRGFTMQLSDPAGLNHYLAAVDEIAAMGCTSINFVMAARVDNVHSATVSMKWQDLPRATDVERILKHAKAKGFYTILMPIVLIEHPGAKEWRGVIEPGAGKPADWDTWFDSYIMYMRMAATLAHKSDVDLYCVGSELLSTEDKRAQWVRTIAEIRKLFPGKLTYSANWDHYDRPRGGPTFWDQLDYIGMNNYNELAKEPGVPLAQLDENWKPIKRDILKFVAEQKKPFLFTEVGWHNLNNTLGEPWNYVAEGHIDLDEQKRGYQSFVDTWGGVGTDQFMGALVWEWVPGGDGVKTKGAYTLQGTPALEVVKKWMAGAK